MRLTPQAPRRPKRAMALQYDGLGAPRLTAKGCAETAERIMAIAEEHGIPIYEDPGLAAALAHLELGEEIPELLYLAIAEVLAFVYGLDTLKQKTSRQPGV
ncbi:MAG: EscU/YscU/HrcU family type III secretion system export apparatus switch protein [Marinospirillum sp.]|uniref:EscU/YscU/HrcU family type III secretion system export apparatus switch protein n=1 Tax=Marinospirillum sp. TaxID=2183934 RepID=UPI001A0DB0CF|nr:EscU/YscU/HrcU family type III secretion system export apparatus switch protein [Marinospirillum sp.]MBE0505286.1 EscU/YscU/HrcU family type III secretion system export apparatus switch protein [Marinospirillum sp.]